MKLLPPKPPVAAGTARAGKKKAKKDDVPLDSSAEESLKQDVSASQGADDAPLLTEGETETLPEMVSAEEISKDIDATLQSMNTGKNSSDNNIAQNDIAVPKEKRKGLFSRLFSKKEKLNDASGTPAELSASDINTGTNTETQGLDNYVSKISETEETVEIPPSIEEATENIDAIESENRLASNASGEPAASGKKEIYDVPVFTGTKEAYSKYSKYSPKDYLGQKNYLQKKDYINYDSNYAKRTSGKNDEMKIDGGNNDDDLQMPENWDLDLNEKQESKNYEDIDNEDNKKKEKNASKAKPEGKKSKIQDWGDDEKTESLEMKPKDIMPAVQPEKIRNDSDFTVPIHEWKQESTGIASSAKPDKKSLKIAEVKLKKLLKVQENKLSKMSSAAKKTIETEIARANKKLMELAKQEKTIKSKEEKLLHLGKSLSKERAEFDDLVNTEKDLMRSKEVLETDVLKTTKELSELKSELAKVKKEFASDRKAIVAEKARLQDEFRQVRTVIESEKKKGEKKLSELAKQVEDAQTELEETNKKNKEITAKLKSKEMLLEQREREVRELIEQEQKIVAVLKNGENELYVHPVHHKRKQNTAKPVTMLDAEGEPQLYSDDEDTLMKKLEDCKDLLSEQNYDDAKLLYNELREEFLRAEIDAQRKKEISHEIKEIYDDICLSLVSPKN